MSGNVEDIGFGLVIAALICSMAHCDVERNRRDHETKMAEFKCGKDAEKK